MAFKLVGLTRPERDPFDPDRTRRPQPEKVDLGRRKQYRNALRKAVLEIQRGETPEVHIFQGARRVAICEQQYRNVGRRGGKFSVVCSGEKPAKKKR